MKNQQTVKHRTKPGSTRKNVSHDENPTGKLHRDTLATNRMILPALNRNAIFSLTTAAVLAFNGNMLVASDNPATPESHGGWIKYAQNPVLGGKYGTCFDISVLRDHDLYRMWVSWRSQKSIALVESPNGLHFDSEPKTVLGPAATGWEDEVNRPFVLKHGDGYQMWYTGQGGGHSAIGYATSADGVTWKRMSEQPVLQADAPWEKVAVMCPTVIWDDDNRIYKMWYSGGEQYEPNAIGRATSPDGVHWTKSANNPVFEGDPTIPWEKERATACQVIQRDGWYYMFYIGFRDVDHAQIGVARSRDGLTKWQRNPANPIVRPGEGQWDSDACYKPVALFDGRQWLLWYNGRSGSFEQIGVALHDGADLGFGSP
jgi:beta-1,2-mannobiose phosphorylase / 1,2-beta-oligomannan phosphorylase